MNAGIALAVCAGFSFAGVAQTCPNGPYDHDHLIRMAKAQPAPLAVKLIVACGVTVPWSGALEAELDGVAREVLEAVRAHAPAPPPLAPEKTKVNPKDGLTYVLIPAGAFQMGCSAGDTECDNDEKPTHQETIAKAFRLGRTEVTQEAYQRVIGGNPSQFEGADLPVETVDWMEAKNYCEAVGGRLPTEAEWEYAARGATTGARYGELDSVAWYNGNSGAKTHPVARKRPNAYGLYDMLGNVWEWVEDLYPGTQYRSLRGGSWNYVPWYARASDRLRFELGDRNYYLGFRCAWDNP